MEPIYNNIGSGYARTRQTDPVIARQLYSELQGAVRIVNIGAGAFRERRQRRRRDGLV